MQLNTRSWPAHAADAPIAVLLHGVTASSRTFWRVGPRLAEAGWRAAALDLRGHGESPRHGEPSSVEDLADDVHETMSGLGESIDLLWGHSLGALTALGVIDRHPGSARRLVLEDPPPRTFRMPLGGGTSAAARNLQQSIAGWIEEVELARSEPEAMLERHAREQPLWHPSDAQQNVASLAAVDLEGLVASVREIRSFTGAEAIGRLSVPTLLVLGSEEGGSILVGEERRELLRVLPAMVEAVEIDAGHTIHRDRFDELMEVVLDWLSRS